MLLMIYTLNVGVPWLLQEKYLQINTSRKFTTRLFIHPLTHSPAYSPIDSFTHSPAHSPIDSLTHSPAHSPIDSFTH
jgi:hypothetical protein